MCCGPHLSDDEVLEVGLTGDENGNFRFPDFLNDRNAMDEAEAVLDKQNINIRSLFMDHLGVIVGWGNAEGRKEASFECHYRSVRSNAAQRAEAFLRTVGKWVE